MVSILQLMGFSKAKPVHSPAGETPATKAQETSARRQDVKTQSGKDTKAKAAPSKPAVAAKAATKVAAKPVAKPAAKPVKAATKTTKPVEKAVAKPAAKAATKPAAKAPVKATPVKSAKPAPQPASKAPVKVAGKTVAKLPSPVSSAAKPSAKAQASVAPSAVVAKEKVSMPVTSPSAKAAPAPATSVAAPAPAPAKAGRPSSRLAQLTVPSIAQSVASTAAKASYSQTQSPPDFVPIMAAAVKKDAKLANNWKTKPVAELTDAELMAMPDSEYMNEVQMAAFRLKLVVLKTDILSSAGETTEHLREDSAVVPDPADRATIEEEHALELRTRDRERKLLKKIEQSIGRIDAGDYGYCDETGEAIGVGRLLARPTATLSLEAQQRRELKQKMFGD